MGVCIVRGSKSGNRAAMRNVLPGVGTATPGAFHPSHSIQGKGYRHGDGIWHAFFKSVYPCVCVCVCVCVREVCLVSAAEINFKLEAIFTWIHLNTVDFRTSMLKGRGVCVCV